IVFVIGETGVTGGLRWEVEQILHSGYLEKVIFVVPPVADATVRRRWHDLASLSGGRIPEAVGDELALAFDEEGRPLIVRGPRKWGRTRRWERDYLRAFRPLKSRFRAVTA